MSTNLVARPRTARPDGKTRGWFDAYRAYLMNPHERIGTKLLPLAALGLIPLSIVDDLLLPFVGVMDDIPTALLVLFAIFRTWQKVRAYRE